MEMWNLADILGAVFLGIGIFDGYRKGLVKKGTSLVITLVTLFAVYIVSPYVAQFLEGILPNVLSIEVLTGTDNELYQILVLSGLGEQAEHYVQSFVARALSTVVTYVVVKIVLRTVVFSLGIVTKVPGLSLLNRVLGAALGLIQQLLIVWLFFLVVMIFSSSTWGSAVSDMLIKSAWIGYLYEHNLLILLGILFILDI